MERIRITRSTRNLGVAVVLCAIGAVAWIVGAIRREAAARVVWAPLWPRPDGSVRSFGEVWDHPDLAETPAA